MAKVFFFSDLMPQAPFSSCLGAAAAVEAALRAVARVAVRPSSLEVAFTAIMFYVCVVLKLADWFQIVLLTLMWTFSDYSQINTSLRDLEWRPMKIYYFTKINL